MKTKGKIIQFVLLLVIGNLFSVANISAVVVAFLPLQTQRSVSRKASSKGLFVDTPLACNGWRKGELWAQSSHLNYNPVTDSNSRAMYQAEIQMWLNDTSVSL